MYVSEANFSDIYHKFCYIKIERNIASFVNQFPMSDKVTGVFCYGYIDNEAGFTFEVLGLVEKNNNRYNFLKGNDHVLSKIRRSSVNENIIELLDYTILTVESINDKKFKIDLINENYKTSSDVENIRALKSLDESREPNYPDDILVYLLKDDMQPEGCWVKSLRLDKHTLVGELLNFPNQNFGVHQGEKIHFNLMKQDNGKKICVCFIR